jgi:hypothetical protein
VLREVPTHDAEAVPQRGVEGAGVETPVRAARDGDEPGRPRVLFGDHAEQPLELGGIGDQFRPGRRVAAAQPDPGRPPAGQVERPAAAARGEQHVAVAHVADRLPVGLPALAAGVGDEHQVPAERRRERQAERCPHGHVDRAHDPRAPPHYSLVGCHDRTPFAEDG